jgi:hypothetical protein
MFVTPNHQLSKEGYTKCRSLQNDFLGRVNLQSRPPTCLDDVRFYVVDWEAEGTQGLINAGVNYLNNTGWASTGGTWLSETFEDNGKIYAIAAAWWQ